MLKDIFIIMSITLLGLVIAAGTALIFSYLDREEFPKNSCNIAIGQYAGHHWTDESLHFAYTMPYDDEYYAEYWIIMTPKEYEVMFQVFTRMANNGPIYRKKPDPNCEGVLK